MDKYEVLLDVVQILEHYDIELPVHPYDTNSVRNDLLELFTEALDSQDECNYDEGYSEGYEAGKDRAAEAIRDAIEDAIYDL